MTFLDLDSLSFRVVFVVCLVCVGCFVFDVEVQRAVGNNPILLEAEGYFKSTHKSDVGNLFIFFFV